MTETAQQKTTIHSVKREELPVSCPPENAEVWNLHPRVYIEFNRAGEGTCPYCGERFKISDD